MEGEGASQGPGSVAEHAPDAQGHAAAPAGPLPGEEPQPPLGSPTAAEADGLDEAASSSTGPAASASVSRRVSFEVSSKPEPSPNKSMRRLQSRADDLRRQFQLPPEEALIEDFMCALRKRMLLQGRLYVFDAHVAFSCNLFGYHKIKVIPLAEVVDVRKKKNMGFPNSIEITLENGKKQFFTSFLMRAEAYKLIMQQWREHSEHAPPPSPRAQPETVAEGAAGDEQEGAAGADGGGSSSEGACRAPAVSRLFRSIRQREPAASEGSPSPPSQARSRRESAPGATGLQPVDEETAMAPSPFELPRRATAAGGLGGPGAGSSMAASSAGEGAPSSPSFGVEASTGSLSVFQPEDSFVQVRGAGPPLAAISTAGAAAGSAAGALGSPASVGYPGSPDLLGGLGARDSEEGAGLQLEFQQLTDAQCQRALEEEFGQSGGAPAAPPADPAMQHVLEFGLPCSTSEFFLQFLANSSDFPQLFHAKRGDKNIRLSKWQRHFKVGLVRDLQFVTPVKAKIGPPQAVCHQTQRLQVFAGRHLVLETSQIMQDIPYGDHFSVESRWDVVPLSSGAGCHISVRLKVPFSKKTLWKGFIEKGSYDQSLESMHQWREMARERLATNRQRSLQLAGSLETEWGNLLSRGGAHHGRKHSRAGSLSQGVPVGRQLPILARHRRSPSRVSNAEPGLPHSGSAASLHNQPAGARSPQPSLSRLGSQGLAESPTARHAQQQPAQSAFATQQTVYATQQPPQPAKSSAAGRAAWAVFGPLLALLGWLASAAASLLGALRASSRPAAIAVGCIIIGLQTALLIQQGRQLSALQAHHLATQGLHGLGQSCASAGVPANLTSSAAAPAAAAGWEELSRDLAALQQAVQALREQSEAWRTQLDGLASTAAGLAAHLSSAANASGG